MWRENVKRVLGPSLLLIALVSAIVGLLYSKLTFENIQNELKPYIKKNEELLAKVAKQHLDTFNELKHKK